MTADFADVRALSFDCYGTLIDWESGLLKALAPLMAAAGRGADEALSAFARAEAREESRTPGKSYPQVLDAVYRALAREWSQLVDDAQCRAFGASVPAWPPFADTQSALTRLQSRFKLCILSNVDHASFAQSERAMGVTFDLVVTAEDARTYKPNPNNFRLLLARLADLGIRADQVLHVAESLFHDHQPAQALGLRTCWIDRRHGRGGGASAPHGVTVVPHLVFNTLGALADAAL